MTGRIDFTELPVPTIARRVQEDKEVEAGVAAVVDEHRHVILLGLSRTVIFGITPIIAYVIYRQLNRGAAGPILWGLVAAIIGIGVGASASSLAMSVRGRIVTYSTALTAIFGVLQFGPLLEGTFAFVAAVLFAALLVGAGHAYIVATFQAIGLATCVYMAWLQPDFFRPEVNPSFAQWLRLSVSSILGLYFFVFLFLRVQSGFWSSLGQQIRLRLREQRYVEEREKMVRSAGSVQRLESLGRLAGGIAHDFNNSLVVIQCGLGALDDELSQEEREEIISEVNEGVNRAATTARQLLSFAKRNVEEIGVCDPKLVAGRLVKETGRLLPANLKLELEVPVNGAVPPVGLSEFAVEQILLTLITNSREALGDRAGRVTIELGKHELTGGLHLRVRDDGPGFPEEIREHVWEPFFTTKGEEHMGLGLSTLWATVRRHGGQVELAAGGSGAEVVMTFPAVSMEVEKPKKRRRDSSTASPPEQTVLILEDEAPIRSALRRVLKHSGLEVVEAATVAEARSAMAGRRFALLISDGVLPDGGVGAFIRDFRAKQRAPVILCSGYLEEDLALEGISKGECSFLPKPFTPEDLIELVGSLLSGEASSD